MDNIEKASSKLDQSNSLLAILQGSIIELDNTGEDLETKLTKLSLKIKAMQEGIKLSKSIGELNPMGKASKKNLVKIEKTCNKANKEFDKATSFITKTIKKTRAAIAAIDKIDRELETSIIQLEEDCDLTPVVRDSSAIPFIDRYEEESEIDDIYDDRDRILYGVLDEVFELPEQGCMGLPQKKIKQLLGNIS